MLNTKLAHKTFSPARMTSSPIKKFIWNNTFIFILLNSGGFLNYTFQIVLTPIEVAIEDVQKKITELEAATTQVK